MTLNPQKQTKGTKGFSALFPSLSSVEIPMHPLFQKADELSRTVIGAAIEVHRLKGSGLIESIYEKCLLRELSLQGLGAVNQRVVRIEYKGFVFEEPLRFDVLVEDCLLLELKSVQEVLPIHQAQLLSYMKLLNIPVGLLINFHAMKLVDGIHRMILPGSNQ
jgi:GxxExxY protein